jgi:hypothetical protein
MKDPDQGDWLFMSPQRIMHYGKLYMWRLRMLRTPWFSVYLHRIAQKDADEDLHDHPWTFASFVLWGRYIEAYKIFGDNPFFGKWEMTTSRIVRWFNFKRAEDAHTITFLASPWNTGVITLVFLGPKRRSWGFYTDKGWIPWRQYVQQKGYNP